MERGGDEGTVEAFRIQGREIRLVAHAPADEELSVRERSPEGARRLEPRTLRAAHPGEIQDDE